MARVPLRLSLDMVTMAMDMVLDMVMDMVMDTMDIMARGLLMPSQLLMLSLLLLLMPSQLPLLSLDMDMVMDMAMDILATDGGYGHHGYYGKRSADAEPGYGY